MILAFSSAVLGHTEDGVMKCVVVRHSGQVRSACRDTAGPSQAVSTAQHSAAQGGVLAGISNCDEGVYAPVPGIRWTGILLENCASRL